MSYMDGVLANKEEMAQEAVYRQKWIEEHKRADKTVFDPKTGMPVAAIYRYPPLAHYRENQDFWNKLAATVAQDQDADAPYTWGGPR